MVMGLPLAVGYVAQLAISFADAALVARIGPDELAGVTLGLSLYSVVMLFGLGVVTAVTPRVAAAFKAGDTAGLRLWYAQGAWLGVLAAAAGIVVLLNTRGILEAIGQDARLASIAQRYNEGAAPGLLFFLSYVNARCLMTAVGRTKPSTWAMLSAVPLDIVLGYLLIFGPGPFPELGVRGAGIASTVVRMFVAVFAAGVLLTGAGFRDLALRRTAPWPQAAALAGLFRVGSWIGVRVLLSESFLSVLAFFVARYGADATAAHAIGLRIESLVVVLALGFSGAATTVTAWAHEENDWRALRDLRNVLAVIGVVYSVATALVIVAAYPFVLGTVFGVENHHVSSIAHKLLPFIAVYLVVDTLLTLPMGYLVGLSDTRVPTIVVGVGYWIVGLGAGVLLARAGHLGVYGLWTGMVLGAALVCCAMFLRIEGHVRRVRRAAPEAQAAAT